MADCVEELAVRVCAACEAAGFEVVLCGGAAVMIHGTGKYVSKDLDFVAYQTSRELDPVMASLGFERRSGRHYESPGSEFLVEFVAPPLAFGDRVVDFPDVTTVGTGQLRVITPTQCVMDRLAAFYAWNDRQALAQALDVASCSNVDLEEIRGWSREQGADQGFQRFLRELAED